MKPRLTPEAFYAAPALIPALSMREVKSILKEFRPLLLRRRRFTRELIKSDQKRKDRAKAAGQLLSVAIGLDKLLNQAFYDYVMGRLSRQGISSRSLSIQIRESTKQRGALDEHTIRLRRYVRAQRTPDRHEGNVALGPFVNALLTFYAQSARRLPGLSRTAAGDPSGPCVRFVIATMNAYAEKLPDDLKKIDPGLSKSLQPSPFTAYERIKDSSFYKLLHSVPANELKS